MTDMDKPLHTVGFIGLGEQGAPIAARIAKAGWPLHLWARRPESLTPFAPAGAVRHLTPKALGEACDLVGICVMNDHDVEEVLLRDGTGLLLGMKPGSVVVLHSTVMPQTAIALAQAARSRDVHLLDAPVSGRAAGAIAGTLTVMVGGDEAVLARVRPILESYANTIVLLGPVGAGQTCKLLCNNVCFANQAVGLAALDLADALGMDRENTAQMIAGSSASSFGFKVALERLAEFGRMRPGSAIGKDQRHFAALLAERGVTDELVSPLAARAVAVMRADEP
jgi:3-hydroxyisobutyrate dehydrogenase-like beta-hydroxyacid dehydrogenase